uniref:hypothetical protein n=1 Tax=Barnesiella intestinihominis TaxID=487174 RepID=UPI003FF1553D
AIDKNQGIQDARLGRNMAGTYLLKMIILFLNKFKTVSKLIYTILKGRKSPITPARENQAFLNEL